MCNSQFSNNCCNGDFTDLLIQCVTIGAKLVQVNKRIQVKVKISLLR